MDQHAAVVTGDGKAGLSLQIELLLTAAGNAPLDLVGALLPHSCRIAAMKGARGSEQFTVSLGPAGIETVRQRVDLCCHRSRGGVCADLVSGHHQGQRLADIHYLVRRQQRLVIDHHTDLVLPRDIRRGEHRLYAGHGQRLCRIDPKQTAVGDLRPADRCMQGSRRQWQIRHIAGAAGDVELRFTGPGHRSSPSSGISSGVSATKWAIISWRSSSRL